MGFSGLFTKSKKYGLLKAYIVAILARGAFHALGGHGRPAAVVRRAAALAHARTDKDRRLAAGKINFHLSPSSSFARKSVRNRVFLYFITNSSPRTKVFGRGKNISLFSADRASAGRGRTAPPPCRSTCRAGRAGPPAAPPAPDAPPKC